MGLINVDLQCGLVFGQLKLNDMNQVMGKFIPLIMFKGGSWSRVNFQICTLKLISDVEMSASQ